MRSPVSCDDMCAVIVFPRYTVRGESYAPRTAIGAPPQTVSLWVADPMAASWRVGAWRCHPCSLSHLSLSTLKGRESDRVGSDSMFWFPFFFVTKLVFFLDTDPRGSDYGRARVF